MTKNSIKFRSFFYIIVLLKSVVTSPKIHIVINFYAKALKLFPEKYSKLFKLLKIIVINENSYCKCILTRWVFSNIDS